MSCTATQTDRPSRIFQAYTVRPRSACIARQAVIALAAYAYYLTRHKAPSTRDTDRLLRRAASCRLKLLNRAHTLRV